MAAYLSFDARVGVDFAALLLLLLLLRRVGFDWASSPPSIFPLPSDDASPVVSRFRLHQLPPVINRKQDGRRQAQAGGRP